MKQSLLFLLATLTAAAGQPTPPTPPKAPAAIVYALSGEASQTLPGQPRHPIVLFDCLPAGAILEVAPGARLALAFASGKRWELGGGARVTLGTVDMKTHAGDVRRLPSVSPLPRLFAIRQDDLAGPAGAVRIRGDRIKGLYPDRGAAVVASVTVLRFQAVEGNGRYRIEVQDGKGAVVFTADTDATEMSLPAAQLRPGASYHWVVRTVGRALGEARGEAGFTTLDRETARRREALRRAAEGQPDLTALLAGLDRQLGLLAEARDELREEVAAAPEDTALRAALADVEKILSTDPEPGDALAVPPEQGLRVQAVNPGLAAARAGLAPGDLLQRWERSASPPANPLPASGPLGTPFDLAEVENEQAPRGAVRLVGARQGEARTWEIPPGTWGLVTAPPLQPGQLDDYTRGRHSIFGGEFAAGLATWQRLASDLASQGEPERAAWLHQQIAGAQIKNGDRSGGRITFESTLVTLALLCQPKIISQLRSDLAWNLEEMGDLALSAEQFQQALDARRRASPESLSEALLLSGLSRALVLQGDAKSAERQLSKALALSERLAPGSLVVTQMLANLGIVEHHLGNLAAAEDLQRRALEIDQKLNPESLDVANDLTNLAGLESARRDFEAALETYREVVSLREKLDPEGPSLAEALRNVGGVMLSLDDPAGATPILERSLSLQRRLHQGDQEILNTLIGLGTAAWALHDYRLAERWLRQALAISETSSPESFSHAVLLNNLADVLLEQRRLAEAETLCRDALAIFQKLAPDTNPEGTAYRDLAVIVRRAGRREEARELYEKALRAIDRAGWRLASSGQGRSDFLSSYAEYYREAVDLLVELGQTEEAFAVLERFRARDLLGLLAERKLSLDGDLPADLESERLSANADYESVLGQFAQLSAVSPPVERKELQTRLDQARLHQDSVRARIRATSPRLASLRDPQPLDRKAVAQALDPGTALLSYSIGNERSYLFVIGPGPDHFAVFPLRTDQKSLRDEVRRLRARIDEKNAQSLLRESRSLTRLLLSPAAQEIAAAKRLLVVADGPLHLLPFAVLADPSANRYLIESKPLYKAASATLFAELKGRRREHRPDRLLAFGDPYYPDAAAPHDPVLRGAVRDGLRLDPLPGTRAEVEALAALYPDDAKIFLGAAATEERAKALAPERSILHFACHALVNERYPLESALVLSLPDHPREGGDNGLLQAWEIFEQVHLDADLVTLSACDSALGKELAGEGLLGLTRAFQYAGAHSIVASLWGVGDAGTARLMQRFYGYLKAGETKDEALRHAQIDLLRGAAGSEITSPFYWAAFEMIGDWL